MFEAYFSTSVKSAPMTLEASCFAHCFWRDVKGAIAQIKLSLDKYKWINAYIAKYEETCKGVFEQEHQVSLEMAQLLPQKMDQLASRAM